MVVDTGTCFIIVRPDIVKHCTIGDTGQHECDFLILVSNKTDDVLMDLDLMEQYKFH